MRRHLENGNFSDDRSPAFITSTCRIKEPDRLPRWPCPLIPRQVFGQSPPLPLESRVGEKPGNCTTTSQRCPSEASHLTVSDPLKDDGQLHGDDFMNELDLKWAICSIAVIEPRTPNLMANALPPFAYIRIRIGRLFGQQSLEDVP